MNFNVSNLANVKNADIDLKPLTIFVGKNGTNKSYMAHLVYELYKEISNLEDRSYFGSNGNSKSAMDIILSYNKTNLRDKALFINSKMLEKKDVIETVQIGLEDYEEQTFTQYKYKFNFNDTYDADFFRDIYNYVLEALLLKINKSYNYSGKKVLDNIKFAQDNIKDIFINNVFLIRAISDEQAIHKLLNTIFTKVFIHLQKHAECNEQFYFPSSRTGFVLAFDEIVSGVFRDRFGGQPTATKLTQPTIDFLSNFAEIKTGKFRDDNNSYGLFLFSEENHVSEKHSIKELISYLEKYVIKGEIIEARNTDDYTQYYLKTEDNTKLDLHVTSSATIELLPLIVFLKHFTKIKNRFLVIEEPEAHLHPRAQILMARFIVMLVNAGAKILITTHSDYMLEEFNNCINLYNSTPELIKEHSLDDGMGEKIYLKEEDIAVYLFKEINKNYIDVILLEIDEEGIPFDNFQDVRDELKMKKETFK